MEKQTAVEQLQIWLNSHLSHEQQMQFEGLFQQAKEMEKQMLQDCFEEAHQAGRFEGKGIAEKDWVTFELWYNETFKSE